MATSNKKPPHIEFSGSKLSSMMKERGYTNETLAKALKVTAPTVSGFRNGASIKLDKLRSLGELFNCIFY